MGHVECVRFLMSHPRSRAGIDETVTVIPACREGNLEIVKLVLADPRVSLDEMDMMAAASKGSYEICSLIFSDPRWNANEEVSLFRSAIRGGNLEVFKLFLKELDTSRLVPALLLTAAKYNRVEIAELWLKNSELLQPTVKTVQQAIQRGCKMGHKEIVSLFFELRASEVLSLSYSVQKGFLELACLSSNIELVNFLLCAQSPRTRSSKRPMMGSIVKGDEEIIRVLFPFADLEKFRQAISFAPSENLQRKLFSWYAWPKIARLFWLGLEDEGSIVSILPQEFKVVVASLLWESYVGNFI
eukprot:TRINITY_DN2564_c1_g2_i2.p2 TRINITY_DN2564_c1_g2~~TRINITY_DN2564_c1_g2_i2.p2  ORF type:complete len:300 (-),score=56.25 TRINITY_DN2564_c1_g2_i2:12-911(-)